MGMNGFMLCILAMALGLIALVYFFCFHPTWRYMLANDKYMNSKGASLLLFGMLLLTGGCTPLVLPLLFN